MRNFRIKRVGALLGGLAITVSTGAFAAGPAAAATGGGCGGPAFSTVCVSKDGGIVNYRGYTDFRQGSGTIHLLLWDYTARPGGTVVFISDFPTATGPHDYRPGGLSNPAPGHDYKAEMRVDWGNSHVDTYLSPDLID